MDKLTIASRAGKGFYKSYIRNIRLAETRPIKGHKAGYSENDYLFTYKGKEYRVNEHICPNQDSAVTYSAKFEYELVELVPDPNEEVEPEPDEVKAIIDGRKDRIVNGTISHENIKWD